MKKCILCAAFVFGMAAMQAQTKEDLKSQKFEKQAGANALQAEADALQAQINALPGWRIGAFGTIGGSFSEFNNWYSQGTPNNSSANLGFTVNAFANLKEDTFFWRNALNVNLAWVKLDDKDDPTDSSEFREATDVFNVSSLYGRKLSEKFAISTLGEYRTTLLNNFNDPGYLDVGVGGTWTPIENLFVVMHPLNYNFVFSSGDTVFESSLGAKIVADYTRQIGKINFKSNLSLFYSYKDADYSNYTWINSFSYKLWKKIGLGFDFGLRQNKQEALNYALANAVAPASPTFDTVDNELQTYWLLGLSYAF
ncbi:DUF3078 domain-containing protein [Bizionia saleffrena]|uniref:DUF3078 domain-containing protein n=1 Tax=Bizionia saleffrena TaxID=291189 RepID=A0A8H2LCL7_9FLAO|nr:DUF3078 domain-containing protein [Bizionia saleffrena]TYB71782.1 DUF3078 domain-containing protein [Bizionia saleffrena]